MTSPPPAPGRSRYDAFASWYDEWIAAPEDDLVARSVLGLIGAVTSQRILDVACGQGRIAEVLAARGNEVTGVDLSADLLAIARRRPHEHITYIQGDVTNAAWWDGAPFDGAVASMALMDIDDLAGVISTVAATVRPGGWFVWSVIHPGFPGVGDVLPSWPPEHGYFHEVRWNTGADGVRGRVGANHRTLSTYLNTLTEGGFDLQQVDEPRWMPASDRPPMPFFLVTRWQRRCVTDGGGTRGG